MSLIKPNRTILLCLFIIHTCCLLVPLASAQQVRLDNLKDQFRKDNVFRMNGGVSASTVFYQGDNASRDPFNWILAGNVNLSFFNQLNMPFSFNFTNLGGNYTYPTMPNRISVHPSYKWVTGHIGSVNMAFSPFTLNGHQFTGVGVDLTPDSPLKVSAMYGRLLKATEYDPESRLSTTAYKRMAYGAKVRYEQEKYIVGMSFLSAYDDKNSLQLVPDSLLLFPQNNIAMSWDVGIRLIKNLTLTAEYGLSFLTRDTRTGRGDAFFEQLFRQNTTTSTYHALSSGLTYQLKKNTFGFGYERIDPNYQTLGAYFFLNDLENFTFNFARPFFKDKLTTAINLGMQHDNLGKDKQRETQRFVGALNLNYTLNENLSTAFTYSSFQTYSNVRSQFDYINEMTNYDNLDTLDFTQLSQNANLTVNYGFGNMDVRKHNLNFNLNYQEAADKRGGIVRTGGSSQFYNLATAYSLFFVPQNIQLTATGNATYNTIGDNEMVTYGPSLGVTTKLFKKMVTTGAAISYNATTDNGDWQGSVVNLRWNATYIFLKKHSLNFIMIQQSRNTKAKKMAKDFTATCAYMYNF